MRKLIPAYLVVLLLAVGCGGSQKPAPDSGGNYSGGGDSIDALGDGGGANTGGDKSDVGLEPAASTKIDATVKSWAEIEQLIASKKGRVVVVDFWATY